MIKIVLISHGPFCQGIKKSSEMIAGKSDSLQAVPFLEGENPEDYRSKLEKVLGNEPAIVLADLKGGTPYNTALYLSKNHKIRLITGMNLPILLSLLTSRTEKSTLDSLVKIVLKPENHGIELSQIEGNKHHAKLSLNTNR